MENTDTVRPQKRRYSASDTESKTGIFRFDIFSVFITGSSTTVATIPSCFPFSSRHRWTHRQRSDRDMYIYIQQRTRVRSGCRTHSHDPYANGANGAGDYKDKARSGRLMLNAQKKFSRLARNLESVARGAWWGDRGEISAKGRGEGKATG